MTALLSGGEIVNLHVGAAGSNIASTFWQLISKEHHLVTSHHIKRARKTHANKKNDSRYSSKKLIHKHLHDPNSYKEYSIDDADVECIQNLGPYFDEVFQRYVPRAVFVDCDPTAKYGGLFEPSSPLKHFFRPENFVFGREGSAGIRPRSISRNGLDINRAMTVLTRETERCDRLQGVSVTHHLGGGAGSGLGCLLMQTIRDDFGKQPSICPMSLLPSNLDIGGRNHAIEIYNTILSLPDMGYTTDVAYLIDNEALYDICFRLVNIAEPGWRDLNHIVATVMSDFSSCMRFPVLDISEDRSLHRLHFQEISSLLTSCTPANSPFVIPGFAPFTHCGANGPMGALLSTSSSEIATPSSSCSSNGDLNVQSSRYQQAARTKHKPRLRYTRAGTRMPSITEITQCLFKPTNLLSTCDTVGHFYSSALAVFRGNITQNAIKQEANYARVSKQERHREWAVWMPENVTCRICPEPLNNLHLSVSWAGASTGIRDIFSSLLNRCETQYTKKAFVHAYTAEGMEEGELTIAMESLRDLIDVYDSEYRGKMDKRIDRLEDKQHLGKLSWDFNLKNNAPQTIFDVDKPVQLQF